MKGFIVVLRLALCFALATSLGGQAPPRAPVANIRYALTFDSATAAARSVRVEMRFDVAAPGPVLLSLPAWTPGAYEINNYARKVSGFSARSGSQELVWDKSDPDTWRVRALRAGSVEVGFEFLADTLDNSMAWARPDFLLVNGTNVFLCPEGMGAGFASRVTVTAPPGWRVATGLEPDGPAGGFRAGNYHDLVDMPFFIGRFDLDSASVDGRWHRLASYPAGALAGRGRLALWDQLAAMVPPMVRVFGETPWARYTTLIIVDSSFGGGAALEHQNSHVGIYHPQFIGTPLLASITAHELFHAWNVKRLRPAELVPYRYDRTQPTTLLWVSEGITDYYADLALVRGRIIDSTVFLDVTDGKRLHVEQTVPVALEDASLEAWIEPTDGTESIYYDKGSLAGLFLDILIRDASDNRRSLDDVLRGLYADTVKRGKGFTVAEWWAAVSRAAGGKSFADFSARYVEGREPLPWATLGPLAGIALRSDSTRELRLGISTLADSSHVFITAVTPGSAAADAGIEPGDQLLKVGEVEVKDESFAMAFRARYAAMVGSRIPVQVRRDAIERTFEMEVRRELVVVTRLAWDPAATAKAAAVRRGILTGR